MASEYSTSHMTPHIYWFLCVLTVSRHRPWNSLVLYLGEIIAVQPVSTRRLALDFTSCYRFSPYYIHLTCRNFIYQHSAVTETTAKQHPLAFILFESPNWDSPHHCPACRTSLIATRFWVVVICPIIKCLTVLEFSFILFDLCLFITIFNFILNYVPIVTFLIFTYHKIWILLIIFCFIWNYWITYFLTCLEVFWSVVS